MTPVRADAALALTLATVVAATGCAAARDADTRGGDTRAEAAAGRLTARPARAVTVEAARGRRRLADDAEIYVPPSYTPNTPSVLVLTLHGANGEPVHGFGQLLPLAARTRLILLAPKSHGRTWDLLEDAYGPDVAMIDRLLRDVFARYTIDPRAVYVAGFSDGASYALSLGLTNGDLFGGIIAFSPGFVDTRARRGKPRIFVSHGADDAVLPIERTSRRVVPTLRRLGYDVTYREFDGPHTVPPPVAREAVAWLRRGRT